MTAAQPDEIDPDITRLIEITYSSTADPAQFEELLAVWKTYMDRNQNLNSDAPHLPHFNRALEIFAAMGRRRRQQTREQDIVNAFTTPAILCRRSLHVQATNAAGQALLDQTGGLEALPDLSAALARLNSLRRTDIVPLTDDSGRLVDCAIISLTERGEDRSPRDATYLIVLTKPTGQTGPTWARLTEGFDLTAAEAEVLFALTSGQTPDDLATARGVSINTVRSQIRRLLDKTGAASLTDMVRQVLMICTQIETVALAGRLAGATEGPDDRDLKPLLTSDGRLMSYRDIGDPDARPMLFLHNMMGGTSLPPHVLRLARRGGWRIIAPSRPGFGASDSVGLTGQRLVDRTVQDMRELLDHLEIDAALILGLMSSAGLAVTFAHKYPTRTAAVLNVAHAAVCDDEMIEAMANPSRTLAATYRKSQAALRFLGRVALASVDMRGPQKMVQRMLSLSEADARLAEDQAIVKSLSAMLAHATVQGGEAFSKDGYVALHDFSDTIRALHPEIPILTLLGADDRIYRPDHALRLVPKVAHYPVEVLPDAGQYLFYGHTETVFARAEALWARAAQRIGAKPTVGLTMAQNDDGQE